MEVIQAGYANFGSTKEDHCPLWLDITTTTALGIEVPSPAQHKAKCLRCKDPRIVEKYNFVLHKELKKYGAYHRIHRLLQSFHTPLTPKEEKEFEKLDKICKKAMEKAEKSCRKLRMGKYQWSPELQQFRDKIHYLQSSLSRKRGCHIGARVLINLSKKVKLNVADWKIAQLEKEIYSITGQFKALKKHHVEKRKSYLDDLAIALARKKQTTKASMVKQLVTLPADSTIVKYRILRK